MGLGLNPFILVLPQYPIRQKGYSESLSNGDDLRASEINAVVVGGCCLELREQEFDLLFRICSLRCGVGAGLP